ncbi:MAG: bifunctional serine/threonine-protein kinase/formylglycine-generating enzyme family protein [Planctomycetota bacterium]
MLAIHADALDLPEADREAFVRNAAKGDDEIFAEVMSLLAVDLGEHDMEPPGASATAEAAPDGTPGERRLGPYLLGGTLGHGATGTVFRALDTQLQRDVAVKVLETGLTTTPSQVARFRSEPRRIARLRHKNIVKIHASGHEGTTSWFAMELIDGHDLSKELDLQRNRSHAALLPAPGESGHVRRAAQLCAEVADALQAAHDAGIVHRDVKPQNLLLDAGGEVHLVDFGLARDERYGGASLTQSGAVLGTVHYMSPEQTQAARAKVDARTDVYSLGVVLYEMLTLTKPFDGGSMEEVWQCIRTAEPKAVRKLRASVPRDLELIVNQAMARDPQDRYATAKALAEDLRRFLAFESIEAKAPTIGQRVRRFVVRNRRLLAAALGAVLFATIGWSWSSLQAREARLGGVANETQGLLEALADASDAELLRLQQHVKTLRNSSEQPHLLLAKSAATQLATLEARWTRTADEWTRAGREAGDDSLLSQAKILRYRLALIFEGNPEHLAALSENDFAPRLTVDLRDREDGPLRGAVSLREIDPVTGQPTSSIPIGDLPIRNHEAPIGLYRISVQTGPYGLREFTRRLRRGESTVINYRLSRTPEEVADQLVPIARGTLELRDANAGLSGINNRSVDVEAFEILRTEVSNAMYREFLELHPKHKKPYHWDQVPAGSARDQLPVVFVSWYDARDYAEWSGLRLLTHAEWMLAARTTKGHRFPWGDKEPWRGNVNVEFSFAPSPAKQAELYFRHARPVTSDPDANTRNGLFHMLGNVWEWSESAQPAIRSGTLVPALHDRVILGGGWHSQREPRDLRTALMKALPDQSSAIYNRGFRCGRSTP